MPAPTKTVSRTRVALAYVHCEQDGLHLYDNNRRRAGRRRARSGEEREKRPNLATRVTKFGSS